MTNIFELNALTIFKSAVVSRRMMTYLAMVFLMITTGPGGTHHLNLEVRTAFWIVWTTAIWLTTFVVFQGFMSWRKTEGWPSWSNTAVIFAIVLIPCSVLSNGITSTMFPLFFNFNIESIVIAGIFVAPILIVMLLEFHVTQGTERSELALPCESKQFFNRLSNAAGLDLIHIAVTDHYLEVKTSSGTEVLLLKLRQATQELSNYPGVQVHRSHWVAYDKIQRKYWQNGRLMLVMSNGDLVPVSRSFRKQLLRILSRI